MSKYKHHFDKLTSYPGIWVKRFHNPWSTAEDVLNEREWFQSFEVVEFHELPPLQVIVIMVTVFDDREHHLSRNWQYIILDNGKPFESTICDRPKKAEKVVHLGVKKWLKKELNVKD